MFILIYKYEGHITHIKFETEDRLKECMAFEDIDEGYVVDLGESKIGFAQRYPNTVCIDWKVA